MSETTEAQAVANLVPKPFVEEIKGIPHLMVPKGHGEYDYHELAELLPTPARKKGSINIHDVDSFIDFSKTHKSDNTNIFLNVNYASQEIVATAVFNDNSSGEEAGWRDHRAVFTPRKSEEWVRWNNKNKVKMAQEDFANFLQDNIGDINNGGDNKLPTGSDILTFVSKLEETRTVRFGSGVDLQNGMVQLEYTETGDDNTKGKLDLFREFGLGLRPFFGGDTYAIKSFLRYRIDRSNQNISFWFELHRPDIVLENATKELILKIKTETEIPIIFGEAGI